MIKKILNKLGYYKLNQLKAGGRCGCCGRSMPKLIWVDEGHNWSNVGLCEECDIKFDDIIKNKICPHGHDYDDCPYCRH